MGLVAEAGLVETQAIVAAASGRPRGGRAVTAGSDAAGSFAAERGGRAAGTPEGGLRLGAAAAAASSGVWATQNSLQRWMRSSGSLKARGLIRFLMWRASLRMKRTVWDLHRCQLQGGEVVPQDGWPGVAAHRVVQPLTGHLFGAEAVGTQEELLQFFVQVADGGGVPGQRADGGDQQKRQFSQGPVFVISWVILAVADMASRQSNHVWGESV